MGLKYLIIMIALATIEINVTESRQSDKKRWRTEKSYSQYVNICNIQDRVSKVHCYCESIKFKTATKADCWVFNGGIAEDDPFWSNFFSQPKLEKLTFNVRADGGLTYVPSKVIVRLDRLLYLNIRYANIYSIQSYAFTNSTTLREIILQKNKITELEKMAFAHLIMLTNVSLAENQISELKQDVFYVLPNLQRLYLSKNSISELHDGCFKHLNNLVKLDLDSNALSVLIRENFQGLSNLVSLNLKYNKLRMIGDFAFAELWNLQELYLDENEIEFVSERGFGGLSELKRLSLSDNKLKTLGDVLSDMTKLVSLDLRNNFLETFTKETVENVLENMKSSNAFIALDGNKLVCDCRLSWLQSFRNESRSKRIKSSLDRLSCLMDDQLKYNLGYKREDKTNAATLKIEEAERKEDISYEDNDLEEEKSYEDTMQDQNTSVNESKIESRKKLMDISAEVLACQSVMDNSLEPSQDEVRYYKTSASTVSKELFDILLVFVCLMLCSLNGTVN